MKEVTLITYDQAVTMLCERTTIAATSEQYWAAFYVLVEQGFFIRFSCYLNSSAIPKYMVDTTTVQTSDTAYNNALQQVKAEEATDRVVYERIKAKWRF